jgi:hypothetical protein
MPRWDNLKKRFVKGDDLAVADLAVPATITASGNTAWFNAEDIHALIVDVTIGGATGTTPSVTFSVETADAAGGNIATVASFAAQTGAVAGLRKVAAGFDSQWRIKWVVTGTTPSFTGVAVKASSK